MTGEISPTNFQELVDYDPTSGRLTWKKRLPRHFKNNSVAHCSNWNTRWAGKPALSCKNANGGLQGLLFARNFLAHRVAWAVYYGVWPEGVIDHINGNPSDNRLINLRDVSHAANSQNMKRSRKNTSSVTGVSFNKHAAKWSAEILANGVREHLGYFVEFEDAVSAREEAERLNNFHENHGEQR